MRTHIMNPTLRVIAAAVLSVVMSDVLAQDDPPTLGKCSSPQKQGDACAVAICGDDGKQTVYFCTANMDCAKSDKKKECTPPKKEN